MLWTSGSAVAPKSRVFVREVDLDSLRLELHYSSIPTGVEVISLSEQAAVNVAISHVLIRVSEFDQLINQPALDHKALAVLVLQFDPALHPVLYAASDFLHGLWLKEPALVAQSAEPLKRAIHETKVIPSTARTWGARLVQYLKVVVEQAMRPSCHPNVYQHNTPDPKYRSWWEFAPTLPATWQDVAKQFGTVVTLAAPTELQAVRVWVESFGSAVGGFQRKGGSAERDSFLCASAYLAALSQHFERRQEPVLSIICLHRAAEWLLVAGLADHNALTYTRGVQLKVGSASPFGFKVALDECRARKIIEPTEKAVLEDLNEWRNQLAYTHYMSTPRESVVARLRTEVSSIFSRVGGSDWRQHYLALSSEIPVNLAVMLDAGSSLRAGIRQVPRSELVI